MLKNLIGRMYSNLVSYSEYSQSKVADAYDFIIKNIIYYMYIIKVHPDNRMQTVLF